MTRAFTRALALCIALGCPHLHARTRIIILSPDAAANGPSLMTHIAESVVILPAGDQLLVFGARPLSQIAAIARPSDPGMNNARIKAALNAQFKPVRDYLSTVPAGM